MLIFSTAFLMVFFAEMGDKTQLIAMMFATKYPWQKVMWGIFLATIANHLLAALAGIYLSGLISTDLIHFGASIAFIIFGLLMFIPEKEEALTSTNKTKHIIFTVFAFFFLGEFGDKTQLATLVYSAQIGHSLWIILLGTTVAMMIADGMGIICGNVLNKYCPAKIIKPLGACGFMAFGLFGILEYFHIL